ncbi:aldose epimerase family protein [Zeaxanthinibacter enoshimensis]|uniref:Galactose mutarotase-like enzyme n=1 Tax=Zeaxanthinibacter enoshimensis TaxID=392009 RepID=A0A4R6TIQ5_9FLAO|nr:aldose 1-epimerase [Zeaxanthinibacter enoshimensis]TDQ29059.1 galactose mutarotase-like enzyme [Zeaxanthinibacter enoshimensis]
MIELKAGAQRVRVDQGELVGYEVEGHEYIHQKGSPGWRQSDTEMFPIIGPTDEAGFKVATPRGEAVQDQHGLLRELPYTLEEQEEQLLVFTKTYDAGDWVRNSKFPLKSTAEWLRWPYEFRFTKRFRLLREGLEIKFIVEGEEGMPFMLGYHPAFKLYTDNPTVLAGDKEIPLKAILDAGSRALEVPDCQAVTLQDIEHITIRTQDFGHFMCWTEVDNMVCLEPITFYPYAVSQENLTDGMMKLGDKAREFSVRLLPRILQSSPDAPR